MSRGLSRRGPGLVSFPRVSGDEPLPPSTMYKDREFSPRERG